MVSRHARDESRPPPPPPAGVAVKADWAPSEIIGSGQFWLLWIIYFFGAAAGLMIIGQAVPIRLGVAQLQRASAGGYLALMPSLTADYFGTKSLGQNYGYLFTAWGCAGLGGPYMIDYIKTSTGAFTNAMYALPVACALGIVLTFFSKRPVFQGA